ncbi:response regulator [Arachidicoccus sp.]|jgi:DNA-binding NarL/FixJ family response regulator|uniref:response regulator transcription factor n=1 Tax=Arachidicoccus sp. TaxID=1872624 RepID=UPI003D1F26FE
MKAINSIKIIIADDHQLFADGLEQLLNGEQNYTVLAKVHNGRLLIQTLNKLSPDLILLDINMPYLNGIEAATAIRKKNPLVKIVFVSMYFDEKIITESRALHVNGFISKDTTADDLKLFLQRIINGEIVFPQEKMPIRNNADNFIAGHKLSNREIEIIQLIKRGLTSKEIACDLYLSELTIETHRKNIFRKLNVRTSAALIDFASKNHL